MLRFRLGPFPVTLEASFLITAVLLSGMGGSVLRMALWVLIVLVSVLVHELGHAVVGLWLGGRPEIVLQGLGGVTFPRLRKRPSPPQQVLLSLAGPVFGLLPGLLALALRRRLDIEAGSDADYVLRSFIMTSFLWAAFNLMPVLPLDGGHVLESVISGLRKKPSERIAAAVSVLVGLGLAAAAFFMEQWFIALFFVLMAATNFARAWQAGRSPAGPPEEHEDPDALLDIERALAAARSALSSRDPDAALIAADRLEAVGGPLRQAAGLRIRAGVDLARGDYASAGLHAGRSYSLLPSADAAVVAARANLRLGEPDRARTWLRRAVEAGAPPQAIVHDPELGALASSPA